MHLHCCAHRRRRLRAQKLLQRQSAHQNHLSCHSNSVCCMSLHLKHTTYNTHCIDRLGLVCLDLPRFASICLDLPRFASICLDLPRFAPPLFTRKTLHYTLLQPVTRCSSVVDTHNHCFLCISTVVRIVVAVCARKNCFNVNQRTKTTSHATLIQCVACHCTSNTLQHTLHRPARLGLPRFASICLDSLGVTSLAFTRNTLHYTLLQPTTC